MRKLFVCLSISALAIFLFEAPAYAQDNIATSLMGKFISQADGWWGTLRGYALYLFTLTLIIEVCLFGIRMALQQSNIAETTSQFITVLLFAGFVAAVIVNYQEWATGIAINGLKPLTGELTGNAVDAGQPVAMAAAIMEKVMPVMKDAGITNFGEVFLYVTCMLIIMVVFILISALVILVTCEFYIIANIGILIIGLGGSKIFKDYAVNVMRYVLSVAIKLFVLQLIVNIGFSIISLSDLDASVGSTIKSIKFVDLFFLIGKSIILLALAKTLPDTCAGIINGSAIGGGNPLVSLGRSAGAMALGAASAGAGYAAGAASALNNAHTVAQGQGATGVTGTVGGMAQAMWNARQDAKAGQAQKELDQNPGSIKNQLRSAAGAVKAQRLLDGGDSGEAAQESSSKIQDMPKVMAADGYKETGTDSADGANSSIPAADGYRTAESVAPEPPDPPEPSPPSAWAADGFKQATPINEKFAADGYSPDISNQGFNPAPVATSDSVSAKNADAPDGYSQAASSTTAADSYGFDDPHITAAAANDGHVVRATSPGQTKPRNLTLVPAVGNKSGGKKIRKSRNRKRKH